ncbi:hypothetical protein UNDKW_2447 [Undibacterium sp. KW1]|uniref:hypothetical protein n=1 Tax=Undibacterium sp. KW1 TaxID=2058624 RepID=UPI001331C96D|nr:hypothetical protein [Undibacterium sp. KW1]BBB60720.1 hypothetical protein UNDKW_2447 [Undibacterium sp. KW1]
MNKGILIAMTILATATLMIWQLWPQAEDGQASHPEAVSTLSTTSTGKPEQMRTSSWPPPFPESIEERKFVPLLPTGPELSAAQSLVATRDGDPRTPPIQHEDAMQETPTAAELADTKAYQQYEARQNSRLYAAYVKAANEEIPRLREAIVRARDMGIPAAEIAKGEEKLRRITAMQGQMLAEHPELQNTATAKDGQK